MATAIASRTCSVEGCERKHFGHGYCFMHYKRLKTTGSLELVARDRTAEALAAFAGKYRVRADTGCWIWTGYTDPQGYARMSAAGGRSLLAHRWYYEQTVGAVPEGLTLDHACHNASGCRGGASCFHRRCVNPAHLEPVSRGENVRRGEAGRYARSTR